MERVLSAQLQWANDLLHQSDTSHRPPTAAVAGLPLRIRAPPGDTPAGLRRVRCQQRRRVRLPLAGAVAAAGAVAVAVAVAVAGAVAVAVAVAVAGGT